MSDAVAVRTGQRTDIYCTAVRMLERLKDAIVEVKRCRQEHKEFEESLDTDGFFNTGFGLALDL